MPLIKVWCLPDMSEENLRRLHQEIVTAVCSVEELGLTGESQMTTLFPADKMTYGLGTDVVVEISKLIMKKERTIEVRRLLSERVGTAVKTMLPKAHVECFVERFNPRNDAFWSSRSDTADFVNHPDLTYHGPFIAYLTDVGAMLPALSVMDGVWFTEGPVAGDATVRFGFSHEHLGTIKQDGPTVLILSSGESQLRFYRENVVRITRQEGGILWLNPHYR